MAISHTDFSNLIKDKFPNAKFKITDLLGDEDHYLLEIADPAFEGKSRVSQHQMINQALEGYIGTIIHALTIKILPNLETSK